MNPAMDSEPVQRANATIARCEELYAERNKLAYLYYRLDLPSLKQLNALLRKLDDRELRMVAAYAQGLAEWSEPEQSSTDAPVPQGSATSSHVDPAPRP